MIATAALVSPIFVGCNNDSEPPAETVERGTGPRIDLQDGDRVVWLGDSITHAAQFTQYLETWFVTRYPDREIEFFNRGIAGDRTGDVLLRFDRDVVALRPSHVVVQLGMNDGGYRRYRPEIGETFEKDLAALLERIEEVGAQAIVVSPTFYDVEAEWRDQARDGEVVRYDDPALLGYDAVMGRFRDITQKLALERGLAYVDVREPLLRRTKQGRRDDPSFSLVPDSIHPSPQGHAVMATTILNEVFAVPTSLSEVSIEPGDPWAVETSGGELRAETATTGDDGSWTLTFHWMASALPWVLAEESGEARVPGSEWFFNRELLRFTGLEPGRYAISLDDFVVGSYSAAQLGQGIDLGKIGASPQRQRALQVALLNRQRNEGPLRSRQDWQVDWKNRRSAIDLESDADEKARLQVEFDEWLPMFEQARGDLETEAATLWQEMRGFVQPIERVYQVRRLSAGFQAITPAAEE